jgi:hypothetical protein
MHDLETVHGNVWRYGASIAAGSCPCHAAYRAQLQGEKPFKLQVWVKSTNNVDGVTGMCGTMEKSGRKLGCAAAHERLLIQYPAAPKCYLECLI